MLKILYSALQSVFTALHVFLYRCRLQAKRAAGSQPWHLLLWDCQCQGDEGYLVMDPRALCFVPTTTPLHHCHPRLQPKQVHYPVLTSVCWSRFRHCARSIVWVLYIAFKFERWLESQRKMTETTGKKKNIHLLRNEMKTLKMMVFILVCIRYFYEAL